jgi:hypothetical protein
LLFLTKECGHFAMTTWEFMGIGGFLWWPWNLKGPALQLYYGYTWRDTEPLSTTVCFGYFLPPKDWDTVVISHWQWVINMFCLCGLHRITTILTNFQISVLTNINQYQPIDGINHRSTIDLLSTIELGEMINQFIHQRCRCRIQDEKFTGVPDGVV